MRVDIGIEDLRKAVCGSGMVMGLSWGGFGVLVGCCSHLLASNQVGEYRMLRVQIMMIT